MGILCDDVLSDEKSIAEFVCKICCQLSENPVVTSCSHVFCSSCLDEWFQRKRTCPCCNATLQSGQVSDLKTGNPLAWRILGRVQMRCPLHVQGCKWVGDYGEVQAHLTNSETHLAAPMGESSPSSATATQTSGKAQADLLKEQGNQRFEARAWNDAIKLYTKAILLPPDEASYYGNRAAAHMMLADYPQCVQDCEAAIARRPAFTKAHNRLAKALCEMGQFEKAVHHLRAAFAANPSDALKTELDKYQNVLDWLTEGKAAYDGGDFMLACNFFVNVLRVTDAVTAQLWLARAELGLGRCDQVLRRTREIVKADMNNTKALSVRGRALYLTGDYDQAVKHLNQALRLDPDEKEAQQPLKRIKRVRDTAAAAKDAAFKREFEQALTLYTEAIDDSDAPKHSPLTAKLYSERAKAALRLKQFELCLRDCGVALYAQDDHMDAWLCKASALHALGRHDEALRDMSELAQLYHNDEKVMAAYNKAQFEVRKTKRTNYYEVLDISKISTENEIKVAYKNKALEYHPDKQVDKTDAEKKEAEEKFKVLGEVLEILTDPMRRKLYDEGYDKEAIEERVKAANRAAREHKKDGCCGGGCS